MIGVSVYPYKENLEDTIQYLHDCANIGIKKVFTNILGIKNLEQEMEKMRQVINTANELDMKVSIDIAPSIFDALNIDKANLDFFEDLGVHAVRLDSGYDGFHEAMMTYKNTNLQVEVNISYDNPYLETILSYEPVKNNIIGCHNFYPQKYTGLDLDHFTHCTNRAKALGVRTAAFIGENKDELHGPHPYGHGLCTLEMHRELPLLVQAKHMLAMGNIDDILIANAFADIEDLKRIVQLDRNNIQFDVELKEHISPLEKDVCLDKLHFNRGDINRFVARSTFVKLEVKDPIAPDEVKDTLHRGMVTLGNSNIGQYNGELNIVKESINNIDEGKNYLGTIVEEELFLIDYIHPWTKFTFKEVK